MQALSRTHRLLAASSFAIATIVGAAGVAQATAVYSIWGSYGPIQGIAYANQAVTNNNSIMVGHISVKSTNGKTIPGGWSGGRATLYRNGAVCSSASMTYYSNPTTSWSGGTTIKNCGHGDYTTKGVTAAYNGNGYSNYYTFTSPVLAY